MSNDDEFPPVNDWVLWWLKKSYRNLFITCPHPPRSLRPNGRPNRFAKAAARKQARFDGHYLAIAALRDAMATAPPGTYAGFTPTHYSIVWYYWRAVSDKDNIVASMKSYLDGCADALGVNDKTWQIATVETRKYRARDKSVTIIFHEVRDYGY